MTTSTTPLVKAAAAAALVLGLAACGGGETPSGAAAPATSAAGAATSAAGAATSAAAGAAGSATASATTATRKVSANTASEDEIKAALTSAGVPNPGRWADEVTEYRPYPADDPDLTKLRKNLAKYNPGQDTVDKIVSTLQP